MGIEWIIQAGSEPRNERAKMTKRERWKMVLPKVGKVYFRGKALTVKQLKKGGVGASDSSIESL